MENWKNPRWHCRITRCRYTLARESQSLKLKVDYVKMRRDVYRQCSLSASRRWGNRPQCYRDNERGMFSSSRVKAMWELKPSRQRHLVDANVKQLNIVQQLHCWQIHVCVRSGSKRSMDCGLVKLIVTVPELEWGASDNATWDDQPYKHDNDDVRYKPPCPVCHSRTWQYNSTTYAPWHWNPRRA